MTGGCRALRTRGGVALAFGVVVMAVAGGCGSGSPTISASAAAELSQQVRAIRAAATAGNRSEARAQLDRLRAEVATLEGAHQIASARAGQILSAASQVGELLPTLPATTTPAIVTEPPSTRPAENKPRNRKGGND